MSVRLRFFGDHSRLHCGCRAVMSTFRAAYANYEWVDEGSTDYDLLIVNGEGSLHHASQAYHRKMRRLKAALRDGRPAALLNAVWQANDHGYDDLLPALLAVQVRETLSAAAMADLHGFAPTVVPDLSYYAPRDPDAEVPDWTGRVVVTDFYLAGEQSWGMRHLGDDVVFADMATLSWSSFVLGLSRARLLVTGRHHAVYAACKARIPFVAVSSNSHKIEGIMASAGVDIAVSPTLPSLEQAFGQADRDAPEFPKLFAHLEASRPAFPRI